MVTTKYQNALKQMVQEPIDEIIDDAVGIAVWKERRGKVCVKKVNLPSRWDLQCNWLDL